VRGDVADREQVRAARRVLALYSLYQEKEDLINIGAYVPGANPELDLAVQARPRILEYLQQEPDAPVTLEQAREQLAALVAWIDQMEKVLRAQAAQAKLPAKAGAVR
jgi:flagellum-specific ATP synthase